MKKCFQRMMQILLLSMVVMACSGCGAKKSENTNLGMDAIEQLKYEDALVCFDAALEAGEPEELVYRGQGIALMGLVRYEEALEAFSNALTYSDLTPQDVEYDINYYMAVCYYKLGRYDEAIQRYDAILALKPKEVDAHFQRGVVRLENGNYDDAIADFETALGLSKSDYGLYIDIYCELADHGYQDVGTTYLQIAVDSDDKQMSNYDRGRLYFYLGNYTYSRNYLEQAKTEGNNSEEVVLLLGKSYEELNDCNYALSLYNDYLETTQNASIYNQLGICYMTLGDYTNAAISFNKGLQLNDNIYRQELSYNQVIAYEYLSDFAAARSLMEDYMLTYPDDELAKREYEFLQTR